MFQQLLANKHHRLYDPKSCRLFGKKLEKTRKKPFAEQEPRLAQPVQSKNWASPMAAQLINVACVQHVIGGGGGGWI